MCCDIVFWLILCFNVYCLHFQPFRVFDMRKFQQNVNRELRRASPDRLRWILIKLLMIKIFQNLLRKFSPYSNDDISDWSPNVLQLLALSRMSQSSLTGDNYF